MRDFMIDLKKFKISEQDLPNYKNAENFARNLKKCSIYKYGNISYSNTSNIKIS